MNARASLPVHDRPRRMIARRAAAGLAALCLGAGLAGVAGCGSSSDPAADTVPSVSTSTGGVSQATTVTTPSVTTPAVTAPTTATTAPPTATTSTSGADGGVSPTTPGDDGGVEPTPPTGSGTSSTDTGTTTPAAHQDPSCKPGTGPGFPDRPQCEPVAGPDAHDEG